MVRKGEIWWADLPVPSGSEPGFKRPVLIIQSDLFNNSKINTVICAVITSNLKLAEAPGNLLLSKKDSGLPKESVINISQIITIDKVYLIEKAGNLDRKQYESLENSLKLVLEIN